MECLGADVFIGPTERREPRQDIELDAETVRALE